MRPMPRRRAASNTLTVPTTFTFAPAIGSALQNGTCSAARWMTAQGRTASRTSTITLLSEMSPVRHRIFSRSLSAMSKRGRRLSSDKSSAHAGTPARASSASTQLPMQPPAPVTKTGPVKLVRSIEKRSSMRIPLTATVVAANLPSLSRNFPKNAAPRQIKHSHGIGDPERGAQELRLDRGRARRGHRRRGRRVLRAGRPFGLRQVDAPADDRGPGGDLRRPDRDRRARRQRRGAEGAGHRHGVPELRALPAHDGVRQHGLQPQARRRIARGDPRAGRGGGDDPRARGIPAALPAPALRRPAPARRDGPRDREKARGVPVRRAAFEPGRQAARRDAHRDQGAAPAIEDDFGLCHPRPDRGDDHGGQDRGHERGPRRAGRLPARAVRQPGEPVRCGLHRVARDEFSLRPHGEKRHGARGRGRRRRAPADAGARRNPRGPRSGGRRAARAFRGGRRRRARGGGRVGAHPHLHADFLQACRRGRHGGGARAPRFSAGRGGSIEAAAHVSFRSSERGQARIKRHHPKGGSMSNIKRRDFLKISAGLAAGAAGGVPLPAEAQGKAWTPEKGAKLRVLRWKRFVQGDEDMWMKNTAAFTKRTGVEVRVDSESWEDVRPKAAVAANVGSGPDIVLSTFDDANLYPEKLLDVTDLANYLGNKYGGWYDVCRQYLQPGGKRWIGLPLGCAGNAFVYRISQMKEAGFDSFPRDTAGFLKLCQALKAKGHPVGFALGNATGDGNTWTHWLVWSFGGKLVDEKNNVVIDSPQTLQALEYAKELYQTFMPGTLAWLDPNNNKAFLDDQISVTENGISIYYAAKNSQDPKIRH